MSDLWNDDGTANGKAWYEHLKNNRGIDLKDDQGALLREAWENVDDIPKVEEAVKAYLENPT